MTVSIANMSTVWMSNSNVYNAISMSVSTMGYGANANSRLIRFSVDGNTMFSVDSLGIIYQRSNTVASLPPASSVILGARSFVTDSNTTTFAARVFSGGSNAVPVFSNGTYWIVG